MPLRVVLIGYGTIGRHLFKKAEADPAVNVVGVIEQVPAVRELVPEAVCLESVAAVWGVQADLVVETATAEVIAAHGPDLVRAAHLLPFSLTAFATLEVEEEVLRACREANHHVFIPHGAFVGLDGLVGAKPLLREVTVTTTKPPHAFGLRESTYRVLYDGPTREACRRYPRNVNVHAALALAGIGFDRQRSRIVADPMSQVNRHEVVAEGEGVRIELAVEATTGVGVTGAFTPASAWASIRQIARAETIVYV